MTGTRLGVYEVVAPLGAGGMGEVYRAHDTRLGRDVAIKLLPASLAADPDRLARFEREARLLATLNHPNIGAIYGVEESDGRTALVLELVEGETLAAALARRSSVRAGMDVPAALAVARQIAIRVVSKTGGVGQIDGNRIRVSPSEAVLRYRREGVVPVV